MKEPSYALRRLVTQLMTSLEKLVLPAITRDLFPSLLYNMVGVQTLDQETAGAGRHCCPRLLHFLRFSPPYR